LHKAHIKAYKKDIIVSRLYFTIYLYMQTE